MLLSELLNPTVKPWGWSEAALRHQGYDWDAGRNEIRAKSLQHYVKKLLRMPITIKWEAGDNENESHAHFNDIVSVSIGWPCVVRSIVGQKFQPGFRVWYNEVHAASRWHPEELEDITLWEGTDARAMLIALCNALLTHTIENMQE
jgi:hypothetical protein